jgi:hypothetical protein
MTDVAPQRIRIRRPTASPPALPARALGRKGWFLASLLFAASGVALAVALPPLALVLGLAALACFLVAMEKEKEPGVALPKPAAMSPAAPPKSKVRIVRSRTHKGTTIRPARTRKCPACGNALLAEQPQAVCARNPTHAVHRDCLRLMQGKCPTCGGQLR